MGGLLPLDLISLILARVPVKCILRLKCVCKLWSVLITSPDFANLHLRLNSGSCDDRLLILLAGEDRCLYSFSLDSPEYPATKVVHFEGFRFNSIVGSCNGLILCICGEAPHLHIVLVNPSTMRYRRVPNLQVPQNYMDVSYGFGFDSGSNDYKVVRIVHLFYGYANGSAFNGRQVMVYSFRNDSWKMVEEDVCLHKKPAHRNGVLVNNKLHWLLWYPSLREHRIASFDVCSEKWSEVPMPDYIENGPIHPKNRMAWRLYGMDKEDDMVDLGVLDGCLCLLTKNYRRLFGEVDVWVMKDYGVKDSWMRLFDASDLDITGSLEVAPIAYTKGDTEILLRTFNLSRVFWYNLKEKRARSADFQGVRDYRQVNVCIPSLVSLPGSGQTFKEKQLIPRHEEY